METHTNINAYPCRTTRRQRPRRSAFGRLCRCAIVSHTPSKTRVSDFRHKPVSEARLALSQSTFLQRLATPTPPKTASGVPYYGYRYLSPELGRWMNRDPIEDIASQPGRCLISAYTSRLEIRAFRDLSRALNRRNSPANRLLSLLKMLDALEMIDLAYRGNPILGLSYAGSNPHLFVVNDSVNRLDVLGLLDVTPRDPRSIIGGIIGGIRRSARDARKQVEDAARQAGLPVDEAKELRDLMPDTQLERMVENVLEQTVKTVLEQCETDPETVVIIDVVLREIVRKLIENPATPPSDEFEWRGRGDPGSREGSWYNEETREYWWNDMQHGPPGPHYDYRDPDGNEWRVYPDGRKEPKE